MRLDAGSTPASDRAATRSTGSGLSSPASPGRSRRWGRPSPPGWIGGDRRWPLPRPPLPRPSLADRAAAVTAEVRRPRRAARSIAVGAVVLGAVPTVKVASTARAAEAASVDVNPGGELVYRIAGALRARVPLGAPNERSGDPAESPGAMPIPPSLRRRAGWRGRLPSGRDAPFASVLRTGRCPGEGDDRTPSPSHPHATKRTSVFPTPPRDRGFGAPVSRKPAAGQGRPRSSTGSRSPPALATASRPPRIRDADPVSIDEEQSEVRRRGDPKDVDLAPRNPRLVAASWDLGVAWPWAARRLPTLSQPEHPRDGDAPDPGSYGFRSLGDPCGIVAIAVQSLPAVACAMRNSGSLMRVQPSAPPRRAGDAIPGASALKAISELTQMDIHIR